MAAVCEAADEGRGAEADCALGEDIYGYCRGGASAGQRGAAEGKGCAGEGERGGEEGDG